MKANKIIEMSQEKSRQKVNLAMEEIQRMRNEGERITVSGLCKRTGLKFRMTKEKGRRNRYNNENR